MRKYPEYQIYDENPYRIKENHDSIVADYLIEYSRETSETILRDNCKEREKQKECCVG